jgi:hypothetical protein
MLFPVPGSAVARCHPVNAYAALMFGYNATGNFREFFDSQWKLEELLRGSDPEYPSDYFFVADVLCFDSIQGLGYAERAFRRTRSPITLLYLGRTRAKYALHSGSVDDLERAIREIDAARFLLGDVLAVRIDGVAAYLLAANAMRTCGFHDKWKKILEEAEPLVGKPVEDREFLTWERFYFAEYYYERGQKDKTKAILEADYASGWGDFDTYCFLALAYELGTGHTQLAQGDRVGPFARAGMAMMAGLQGRQDEALEDATQVLNEYDTPEIVMAALDAMVLSGITSQELERRVSEKKSILELKNCSSHSRKLVDRIIPIYGGQFQEDEILHPPFRGSAFRFLRICRWAASQAR